MSKPFAEKSSAAIFAVIVVAGTVLAGGVAQAQWKSAKGAEWTNDKVGIGLSAPAAALDINCSSGYELKFSGAGGANVLSEERLYWLTKEEMHFGSKGVNSQLVLAAGKLGIGTLTPGAKLDVAGSIRAQEVVVEGSGADYVFAPNYNLAPLSKVETFIKANRHLPGIPTAKQVQKKGMSVSAMQTKLLEKVEELTLYVIDLKKKMRR